MQVFLKKKPMKKNIYLFSGLLLAGLTSNAQVSFQNRSHSPTFVNISTTNFPGVQVFSLVGSADTLPQSTTFRFGGSADGARDGSMVSGRPAGVGTQGL